MSVELLPRLGTRRPVRIPYWLDGAQRDRLADAIHALLDGGCLPHPALSRHLAAVLIELGVASARDRVWPVKADRVRRATGLPPDALPVRMSAEEVAAVLSLPDLGPVLRGLLDPTRPRPADSPPGGRAATGARST